MKNKENKIQFASISRERYKKNSWKEHKTDSKYIKFGEDNQFPSYLIHLYNNSSIHAACVNAIVEAIRGEGLVTENESYLDSANRTGESWTELYNKLALDYKLFGGFALEVIWSRDRSRIAEVYHIDFSYIRSGEKNERGECEKYYISDEWRGLYTYGTVMDGEIPSLPKYNPATKAEEPKQLYYHNPYRPGQKYYPLPDYMGATKVIDLDGEVDNFHINNIQNGLAPSLAITTFTNANDDERAAIENMLRMQYSGTDNAGSLLYMDVDDPVNAPQITPISSNGNDTYYTTVNDMVMQKILTAHRITSPALLGIKENVGLGNNAEELETAWNLFLNAVVLPYQQEILGVLEYLLSKQVNQDVQLGVIQKNPLYQDDDNEIDVVTSQESTVEETADIQEQVEDLNKNELGKV
jgi:hypothetical protein